MTTTPATEAQRVGATLKTLRERRGFTTANFAELLGISRPYLANIEGGRRQLSDQLLHTAAEVLGCEEIAIKIPART